MEKTIANGEAEKSIISTLFMAKKHIKEQLYLVHNYNGSVSAETPNKNFVLNEFSSSYLTRLEEIIFPPWYTACLMSECESSSVWGNYGVNHTGMCLIFEAEEVAERYHIKLNKITGIGGRGLSYSLTPMQLHPMTYGEGYGEIEFFPSIGRLPMPVVNKMWHYDENNNQSMCAEEMSKDEEKWRSEYWGKFIRDISFKSVDWEYENEYRLILNSNIVDLEEKERRTLTYEFSSLKGIIFGMKTSQKDKISAMKIIENKCLENSRDDFKFYQAYYSAEDNCIKKAELNVIKFTGTDSQQV